MRPCVESTDRIRQISATNIVQIDFNSVEVAGESTGDLSVCRTELATSDRFEFQSHVAPTRSVQSARGNVNTRDAN